MLCRSGQRGLLNGRPMLALRRASTRHGYGGWPIDRGVGFRPGSLADHRRGSSGPRPRARPIVLLVPGARNRMRASGTRRVHRRVANSRNEPQAEDSLSRSRAPSVASSCGRSGFGWVRIPVAVLRKPRSRAGFGRSSTLGIRTLSDARFPCCCTRPYAMWSPLRSRSRW